ncbi:circadian clock KaiB family protein [Ramlibacter sp. AN1015]|uniref:circadian clock KaiB family protein n=1 Tax=Ramlibacter sp. AN1015 TaxID=3133428 RepID=UPI0030BF187F
MNTLRFQLYVAGASPNSVAAIRNLEAVCANLPTHSFQVEVIDVLTRPKAAAAASVVLTPTLDVTTPTGSTLRLLGSLSDAGALRIFLAQ